MKTIYLVRHGESTSNVTNVVQDAHDELTSAGIEQAKLLAERLKKIEFKNLLVSSYVRAKQTVVPLIEHTTIQPQYLDVLVEIKRPTSLVHTPIPGEGFVRYTGLAQQHIFEPGWHFEDEENYYDIVARVENFFKHIDTLEGDTVVVTHGRFMIYIVMYVLMSGKLTPEIWNTDFATFITTNTGITVLTYKDQTNLWALTTYNDHAHFAE